MPFVKKAKLVQKYRVGHETMPDWVPETWVHHWVNGKPIILLPAEGRKHASFVYPGSVIILKDGAEYSWMKWEHFEACYIEVIEVPRA